ncbi:hypothetical protein RYX36_036968 [Vicia faba]
MSSNKKNIMRTIFTTNGSCGSCVKPKAIQVHEPTLKPKNSIKQPKVTNPSSNTSSTTTSRDRNSAVCSVDDSDEFSTTTFSEADTVNNYSAPKQSPLMNTVAVEKDSQDPYHDFKHSMLQMIFENEIDSKDDLQDLLSHIPTHIVALSITTQYNFDATMRNAGAQPPPQFLHHHL